MSSTFLLQLRKKRNLTQDFVVSKIGVSRPTYIQLERGNRDLTVPEAKKLANFFGMSLADFLNENPIEYSIEITGTKPKPKIKQPSIRISVPQSKVDKFQQVLLYILKKVGGKPNIGMTALYKLLYFIDFDYYEKFEE